MLAAYCGALADDAGLQQRALAALTPIGTPGKVRHRAELPLLIAWRDGSSSAQTASSTCVLFDGWLDNAAELAERLGLRADSPAALVYGEACARWGDSTEQEAVGNYAAIVADPEHRVFRLSRSAMAAPPLHFCATAEGIAAASLPLVLVAMGLPRELNRRKLADALFANTASEESYLQGSFRVRTGEVVHLSRTSHRSLRTFDATAPREPFRGSSQDWVEEAGRLLTEASRAAIAGAVRPGVQLSGGLDSPIVAAHVLRALPTGRDLPAFTFVPLARTPEPDPRFIADERPLVEAFAAMHPRLVPHFIDDAGRDFASGLDRLIAVMGALPGVAAGGFRFSGLFEAAGKAGCDLLLSADHGNFTFSNSGSWGFGEYFRRLNWGELAAALRDDPFSDRPMWRRFVSRVVVPHLPDRLWHAWRGIRGNAAEADNALISLLRPGALAEFDVVARARTAGAHYERDQYAWRRDMLRDQFARGDGDSADFHQALTLIHGVRSRDVTAYRPLAEFCLSLPTQAFMRGGTQRWLARELARGIMPEAQRLEQRAGFQAGDWHARMTPLVPQLREEVERAREIPEAAELLDLDALSKRLDAWPRESSLDLAQFARHAVAIPRTIAAIRYIRLITGTNRG